MDFWGVFLGFCVCLWGLLGVLVRAQGLAVYLMSFVHAFSNAAKVWDLVQTETACVSVCACVCACVVCLWGPFWGASRDPLIRRFLYFMDPPTFRCKGCEKKKCRIGSKLKLVVCVSLCV